MRMHTGSGDRRGAPAIVHAALGGLGRRFGSALAKLRVTLRVPAEARMPSLDGATGWLNSEPLTPCGPPGKGRSGSVLGLYLYRVAAYLSIRQRLVGEVQVQRYGRNRSAHTRIQF